jgi:hypothetical protein
VSGPSQELEPVKRAVVVGNRSPLLEDDEIRRLFRVADALAQSGMFKDAKSAEQAFAKMIVGRDLGLSAAQSLSMVQVVENGVQMHYAGLGMFVRAREGYDYWSAWLKRDDPDLNVGDEGWPGPLELVRMDQEDPDDLRPVYGAVVVFTIDGQQVGVSRYTEDDARDAKLIKAGMHEKAAWLTSRRNMLIARAMSNGVKWFVPEVLAGIPVYVEGELPPVRKELTAGEGDGSEPEVQLDPKVEKIIERGKALEHPYYSNRATIAIQLGMRSPQVAKDWVAQAKGELDAFEAEKNAEPEPEKAADVEATAEPEPAESEDAEPEGDDERHVDDPPSE